MDNFNIISFYKFELHLQLHDILREILRQLIGRLRIEGTVLDIFMIMFWNFLLFFE